MNEIEKILERYSGGFMEMWETSGSEIHSYENKKETFKTYASRRGIWELR